MTTSEGPQGDDRHVPPNGSAWQEAQRLMRERNDNARQAGKERRQAEERRLAANQRAERERGIVYR